MLLQGLQDDVLRLRVHAGPAEHERRQNQRHAAFDRRRRERKRFDVHSEFSFFFRERDEFDLVEPAHEHPFRQPRQCNDSATPGQTSEQHVLRTALNREETAGIDAFELAFPKKELLPQPLG